jgi:hypothetical protein
MADGFSFEIWRVAWCRSRHRVDSLRRRSHPNLWFVRRLGSSPVSTPPMRWVFQFFEGIDILHVRSSTGYGRHILSP